MPYAFNAALVAFPSVDVVSFINIEKMYADSDAGVLVVFTLVMQAKEKTVRFCWDFIVNPLA